MIFPDAVLLLGWFKWSVGTVKSTYGNVTLKLTGKLWDMVSSEDTGRTSMAEGVIFFF